MSESGAKEEGVVHRGLTVARRLRLKVKSEAFL